MKIKLQLARTRESAHSQNRVQTMARSSGESTNHESPSSQPSALTLINSSTLMGFAVVATVITGAENLQLNANIRSESCMLEVFASLAT